MKNFFVILMLLLAAIGSSDSLALRTLPRTVQCAVHVRDDAGQGVPKVSFLVSAGGSATNSMCTTDNAGDCVITVPAPDGPFELVACCTMPGAVFDLRGENNVAVRDYLDAVSKYHFERWYAVQVAASDATALFNITASDAISIRGRLSSPVNCSFGVFPLHGNTSWLGKPADLGQFVLGGNLCGRTATLCFGVDKQDRRSIREVVIPAVVPGGELVMPDVAFPAEETNESAVQISVSNRDSLPQLYGPIMAAVTLISNDYQHVYTFRVNMKTGEAMSRRVGGVLKVVPGTYYVVLGNLDVGGANGVYSQIRDGHTDVLDATGFPKLEVPNSPQGPISFAVDGADLWAKMRPLGQ